MRKTKSEERLSQITQFVSTDVVISVSLWLLFVLVSTAILSFEFIQKAQYLDIIPVGVIILLASLGAAFYTCEYQKRIIKNHARLAALVGVFAILLATAKLGTLLAEQDAWTTGTAVAAAIILAIAYNQRFALGMSIFYCALAHFAVSPAGNTTLLLTMASGAVTCCFALREIRTRMKLLEVSTLAAVVVFATTAALDLLAQDVQLARAFYHALATFIVGLLIQSLLPLIEKIFKIATSMTLLDYSDANQPLLKRLAMEAPGTYSHSLLVGSIAEVAAQAIGRNGLLSRVGAYYHDIGKINKPGYFVENELGSASRHKELSPAMSQLIIVGHVKDGIEMAKDYHLPAVLRQFIDTHHGTTLIEYFYDQAKKKHSEKRSPDTPEPSESAFRYAGPKPRTKEAAIVMLADAVESAVRSITEPTPTKIEAAVHNIAMKRLQDGQFDECDLSLRELSQIEDSMSKTLAVHYHGRIAYPQSPEEPTDTDASKSKIDRAK